jgi:hypothetical protein
MTEPPNQFGDGAAYERMMGHWRHLVGEKFPDWPDAPKGLRWIDVGCGKCSRSSSRFAAVRLAE